MTCGYKAIEPDIILPEDRKDDWANLLDSVANNGFDGLCAINDLADFQKQPKHWPDHKNIPGYCLYLGSFEDELNGPVDLYHYRDWMSKGYYSTGIVFGNEDNE